MFCDKKIPTPPLSPPLHGWGTGSRRTKGKAIGREKQLCCPLSPYISLYLPISSFIFLYLPLSPYISLYLLISPYISLYLLISPSISLYLPLSPFSNQNCQRLGICRSGQRCILIVDVKFKFISLQT